ncbi:MAG: ATP-dependent DNA helicase RecG [Bacilli bacterium]|nr:ATP-dependent DNA helicase RecG [Bacilli bacterium]
MELKDVKGIGPKSLVLLNKLNIYTVTDLIEYYPVRYDVLKRSDVDALDSDMKIIIDGRVESIPLVIRIKAGLNKMNFRLATSDRIFGVSIFNRAFMKQHLGLGTNVIVIGKYDKTKNVITASDIKIGTLGNTPKIESVYHLTNGLTNKNISTYVNMALLELGKNVDDNIPDYLALKYDFLSKKMALNIIHNPSDIEKLKQAKIRLKYEELFEFMFKINYLKRENTKLDGIERKIYKKTLESIYKIIPFKLTKDQKNVLEEIRVDLNSPKRMNRLLQGDVGSGKTIVSIIAMYLNCLEGYQSALMVPTEILANQHFNNIKKLLGDKVRIELLTGSTPKKDKIKIYEGLANGEIEMIIGTHALIQNDVVYKNLGLVVTDEQHRFGVNQRENLKNKGKSPDVLYMSATPIPRTYALTIYGDMDVSTIKELPKGRQEVTTILKSNDEISDVLELMYEELKLNHQIYVIAPLIEENESGNLTSVNELKNKMNLAFGKKYKIDIVHGKMASAVKDEIMTKFSGGEIDILISTTVIEVGIDVKNASQMVIFDANRFGLSTLHQLRGRVGRGNIKSTCILISSVDTKRLEILKTTTDGFKLSEEDFKLRGSGDLFGTRQSGDLNFKIASIKEDYKILVQAGRDSKEFLDKAPLNNLKLRDALINKIKNS